MEAVIGLGLVGEEAVPLLVELVGRDEELPLYALFALFDLGSAARGAVPALVQALAEGRGPSNKELKEQHQKWAIYVLGRVGPEAREAIPVLIKLALQCELYTLWMYAAHALALIDPRYARVARVLCQTLRDAKAREAAARALIAAGPEAAVPSLVRALTDPGDEVRWAASAALARIGEAAVPALIAALADPSPEIRGIAAFALGAIGPAAAPAVPTLRRALKRELCADLWEYQKFLRDRDIDQVVETLAAIGIPAVPVLLEALQHEDHLVRMYAARALGQVFAPDQRCPLY